MDTSLDTNMKQELDNQEKIYRSLGQIVEGLWKINTTTTKDILDVIDKLKIENSELKYNLTSAKQRLDILISNAHKNETERYYLKQENNSLYDTIADLTHPE